MTQTEWDPVELKSTENVVKIHWYLMINGQKHFINFDESKTRIKIFFRLRNLLQHITYLMFSSEHVWGDLSEAAEGRRAGSLNTAFKQIL